MRKLTVLFCVLTISAFLQAAETDKYAALAETAMKNNPTPFIHNGISIPGFKPGVSQLVGTTADDPMFTPYYQALVGTPAGWDIFMSVDPSADRPGAGEIDAHDGSNEWDRSQGGPKGDLFILGDFRKPYYAGKANASDPEKDFVYITRFDPLHSVIRLHGSPEDYVLAPTQDPVKGTAIFLRTNDDMIGQVEGLTPAQLDLKGPRFFFDAAPNKTPAISGIDQIGEGGVGNVGYVAVDEQGNLYQAFQYSGELKGVPGTGSWCLAKYDPSGKRLWLKRFGSSKGAGELPWRIVASSGNVFVAGGTQGDYGGQMPSGVNMYVAFVAKIDADGNEVAVKWLTKPGKHGFIWSMTADDAGNLYCAGGTGDNDVFLPQVSPVVIKLKQSDLSEIWRDVVLDGNPAWQLSHECLGGMVYVPSGTPGNGLIYSSGYTTQGPFFGSSMASNDVFYLKHDDAGNRIWGKSFGLYLENEIPWQMAADSKGNIYVAGMTHGGLDGQKYNGSGDGFVRKMDPDGKLLWTRLIGTSGSDEVHGMILENDTLYLSGNTHGELSGKNAGWVDIWVGKMDLQGKMLDTKQFGTERIEYNFNLAKHGNRLYVSGMTEGSMVKPIPGGLAVFLTQMDAGSLEFVGSAPSRMAPPQVSKSVRGPAPGVDALGRDISPRFHSVPGRIFEKPVDGASMQPLETAR